MAATSKMRTVLVAASLVAAAGVALAVGPPAVGAAAPAFTLTSDQGKPTSLADYKGKWVVLYFYPKDFTGG
jgi:peroxiredoxin Q/BCP